MLEAIKLKKTYGDYDALKGIDLTINPGDIYCLLGANGAGKTTTINLFLNFIDPTAGTAKVCGIDVDIKHVESLKQQNYNVIIGDAEDIHFWRTIVNSHLRLVMLSLPTHKDALLATRWLKIVGYNGQIGAITKYEEERTALLEAGVNAAYNYYAEVGVGFADHIEQEINGSQSKN